MENKKMQNVNEWESFLALMETEQIEKALESDGQIEQLAEKEYRENFLDYIGGNYNENHENTIKLALRFLTKRERETLQLIYWENYNLSETAEIQNLCKSTVSENRNRALRKIKQVLENFEDTLNKTNLKLAV